VAVHLTTKQCPSVFAVAIRIAIKRLFNRLKKFRFLAFRFFPVVVSIDRFRMRVMLRGCVRQAFSLVFFALLIFIKVHFDHVVPPNRDYRMVGTSITNVADFVVGFIVRGVSMAVQIERVDS